LRGLVTGLGVLSLLLQLKQKIRFFKFPAKWILEISRQKKRVDLIEGAVWLGCHEDVVSYSLVACKGCYWQLAMSYMSNRLSKDKKDVELNIAEQR
jgi:hypothetical protein